MGGVRRIIAAFDHMPLAPGARIGPYAVLSPIGAGGMGEVYRARDARLGRDVAIKALPDLVLADPERIARFERCLGNAIVRQVVVEVGQVHGDS